MHRRESIRHRLHIWLHHEVGRHPHAWRKDHAVRKDSVAQGIIVALIEHVLADVLRVEVRGRDGGAIEDDDAVAFEHQVLARLDDGASPLLQSFGAQGDHWRLGRHLDSLADAGRIGTYRAQVGAVRTHARHQQVVALRQPHVLPVFGPFRHTALLWRRWLGRQRRRGHRHCVVRIRLGGQPMVARAHGHSPHLLRHILEGRRQQAICPSRERVREGGVDARCSFYSFRKSFAQQVCCVLRRGCHLSPAHASMLALR